MTKLDMGTIVTEVHLEGVTWSRFLDLVGRQNVVPRWSGCEFDNPLQLVILTKTASITEVKVAAVHGMIYPAGSIS